MRAVDELSSPQLESQLPVCERLHLDIRRRSRRRSCPAARTQDARHIVGLAGDLHDPQPVAAVLALQGERSNRRDALWTARGYISKKDDALALPDASATEFDALSRGEEIVWDYRASSHSTRGHPMQRVRPALTARRIPSASELVRLADGAARTSAT